MMTKLPKRLDCAGPCGLGPPKLPNRLELAKLSVSRLTQIDPNAYGYLRGVAITLPCRQCPGKVVLRSRSRPKDQNLYALCGRGCGHERWRHNGQEPRRACRRASPTLPSAHKSACDNKSDARRALPFATSQNPHICPIAEPACRPHLITHRGGGRPILSNRRAPKSDASMLALASLPCRGLPSPNLSSAPKAYSEPPDVLEAAAAADFATTTMSSKSPRSSATFGCATQNLCTS